MCEEKTLSAIEIERYNRHLILEGFGDKTQLKLKNTSVLIIGMGGVGSPLALFLTTMGFGKLGIVDDDSVELSNLPRQVLFQAADIGQPKVLAARDTLSQHNENVEILTFNKRLTLDNESCFDISNYDYIIDGSDNFETKLLLNKLSLKYKIPLISISVLEYSYQVGLFNLTENSPCLVCLYPNIRAADLFSCSNTGVLGFLPSQSALTSANLLMNNILGKHCEQSFSELFCYDCHDMQLNKYKLVKDVYCKSCSSENII